MQDKSWNEVGKHRALLISSHYLTDSTANRNADSGIHRGFTQNLDKNRRQAVGWGLKSDISFNYRKTLMANLTVAELVTSSMRQAASDAEFLREIPWTNAVEPALAKAAKNGDLESFWDLLTKQVFGLGTRALRKKVGERRYRLGMSLWAVPETSLSKVWTELAARLESARQAEITHRTRKKNKSASEETNGQAFAETIKIPRRLSSALTDWLESPNAQTPSAGELLILLELLRFAGSSLPAKLGVPLWRCGLLAAGDWAASVEDQTLLAGEVPWVLGLFFANVQGTERLCERGSQAFRSFLEDHTDTDGTLRAQEMEQPAAWLPALVRAAEWAYAAERPLWDEPGQERFQAAISRVTGCFAGDGHLAFAETKCEYALPMLLTAARLAGGSKKEWPLKFLLETAEAGADSEKKHSAKLKTSRRRTAEGNTDSIVQQSDWARMACLRTHAGRDADAFAITHHRSLPQHRLFAFRPRHDSGILGVGSFGGWKTACIARGMDLRVLAYGCGW